MCPVRPSAAQHSYKFSSYTIKAFSLSGLVFPVHGFFLCSKLIKWPCFIVSVDSDVQRNTKSEYYWERRVSKASRRQLSSRHSPGGWGRPQQQSISVSTRHFPNLIVPSCFVFGKCPMHISTRTSVTTHVFVFSLSHSNKTLEWSSSGLRPVPHPSLLITHWTPYHITKQTYSLSYAQRIVMYHKQTNKHMKPGLLLGPLVTWSEYFHSDYTECPAWNANPIL